MKQSVCFFFSDNFRAVVVTSERNRRVSFLQKTNRGLVFSSEKNRALDQNRAEDLLFQRKTEHISALPQCTAR
jgi:hypothetical protein